MSYIQQSSGSTGTVTGPGSSVAGNLASFGDTSGIVLADSGTRVAPIFSTAVTGTAMVASGTNTVLVGPVTMVTPGANGAYRFAVQLIQTTPGNTGTCTVGTIAIQMSYKDADTAVTYTFVPAQTELPMFAKGSASIQQSATMAASANGQASNYSTIAKEFRAASGVAIQYQVSQITNSNCTTPPIFATRPALYYMGY